ncbi:uncharacterized protein, partial [Diadema antillarum]|uniref:uncharacterized protein n=1 Tax=Diadema antillarum TaxID=105358 RepID=UPI003A88B9E1
SHRGNFQGAATCQPRPTASPIPVLLPAPTKYDAATLLWSLLPMEDCLPQEPSHLATTMAQSDGSHFRPYNFQSAASISSSCLNPPTQQHSMPHSGASPAYKRRRYSSVVAEDSAHSDIDDEKDIETLSKDLLILRKQKLVLEKEKLEIEKEKLVIERDILDMQRERQWLQLEKARAEQPNARPPDMTANHTVMNKTTEHLASD